MTITGIRDNVQALLVNMGEFVDVIPHPEDDDHQFNGYPSVTHFYEESENNYATVSQNRRVNRYTVYIYVKPGDNEDAYERGEELMDKVIQMFDESIDLSSTALNLGRACDIMRPSPGAMTKDQTSAGEQVICEITLYCESDMTFRN